jgi:N-glycosylase/DNA lyase
MANARRTSGGAEIKSDQWVHQDMADSPGYPSNPDHLLVPEIKWGSPAVLFTPAYWAEYATRHVHEVNSASHRIGSTFKEECLACLLGGHGIKGELGNAAFDAIMKSGLIKSAYVSRAEVLDVLKAPLVLPNGRKVHYRFPTTKSSFVTALLNADLTPPRTTDTGIRDWLTSFPGIGLKTASWIVRNWYDSDQVAIIDIHIYRAGRLAGFFLQQDNLARDYRAMERRYLAFAAAIGFRPAHLDAVIWMHMRQAGSMAIRCLHEYDNQS